MFHKVEPAGGAAARQKMTVGPGAAKIRPHVVCAVLRGMTFNAKSYKSFMDLQVCLCVCVCLSVCVCVCVSVFSRPCTFRFCNIGVRLRMVRRASPA